MSPGRKKAVFVVVAAVCLLAGLVNNVILLSSYDHGFDASRDPESDALRVTDVSPGRAAAEAGLQAGDRINRVNGQTVASLAEAGRLSQALNY